MPHPRPTGPAEALSTRLRSATSEVHKEAEARPFMQAFFAGQLPRAAYVEWLARQWHLYTTLEEELRGLPPDEPAAAVVPAVLYRADRIAADLTFLTDGTWVPGSAPSPATARYGDRIRAAAAFPPALVAHAWLRYLGNVGGRDVLRRLAASSTGLGEDAPAGLAFTDFSAVGEIRPFFQRFHAALDGLELSEDDQHRVVAEAEAGFRLNIELTDELAADCAVTAPAS
jgi:heme oxygenase (biliverdin-producing, ferredoxin)